MLEEKDYSKQELADALYAGTISGGTVTAICGTSDLNNPRPAIGKREYNVCQLWH